ncbi:MAG: hypothetical protein QOE90_3119 [Thermoplasmata archaeon]|nr:hypothetical protein [Thermoplasmata archaeon]
MPTRVRALLLALVLLVPTAAASMTQPAWSEGDAWSYAVEGGGNATLTVGGLERVAAGTLANAWNVSTARNGTASQSAWYRDEDLALMRESSGPVTYSLDAPCRETRFPLHVGDAWNVSCALRGSDGSTPTIAANWTVLREEDLAVPAGAFHAFVLEGRFPGGALRRDWWAPAACQIVRSETYAAPDQLVARSDLVAFRCAQAPNVPTPVIPSTTPGTSTAPAPTTTTSPSTTPGVTTSPPPVSPRSPAAPLALLLAGVVALAILRKRS